MPECLFCRIARREVPARIAHEDAETLAFHDINPQAPTHLLIIPKRHIPTLADVTLEDSRLTAALLAAANLLAKQHRLHESGYRVVINCGAQAGQSVWHLHLHLLGGRPMTWPPG